MKFQFLLHARSAEVVFQWAKRLVQDLNSNTDKNPPIGSMVFWPMPDPPLGWLFCDGSAVNTADYPELFVVLGNTTGTTFNLPNETSPITAELIIRAL